MHLHVVIRNALLGSIAEHLDLMLPKNVFLVAYYRLRANIHIPMWMTTRLRAPAYVTKYVVRTTVGRTGPVMLIRANGFRKRTRHIITTRANMIWNVTIIRIIVLAFIRIRMIRMDHVSLMNKDVKAKTAVGLNIGCLMRLAPAHMLIMVNAF